MSELKLPADVVAWLNGIFRECNERITEKLCNNPNAPEESLDLTLIAQLSRYSSPVTLASSWTVKVEVHYLGGLRHFHRWEIADIGVLLFIRSDGRIRRSKVALLQSKRLYPTNMKVTEEGKVDYEVGFARLADPEDLAQAIAVEAEYTFTDECRYGAITPDSDQVNAITDYEKTSKLPVYYQLYNPWTVPFAQRVPLAAYSRPEGPLTLGVRIAPAKAIHVLLTAKPKAFRPTLKNLTDSSELPADVGWPLETFVSEAFLECREGAAFNSIGDASIQALFYRRSGPIAAAIAITIEGPEAAA